MLQCGRPTIAIECAVVLVESIITNGSDISILFAVITATGKRSYTWAVSSKTFVLRRPRSLPRKFEALMVLSAIEYHIRDNESRIG